ncbi:hypothetical protein GTO10_03740 [Candidatus Saccharibacteria bacterium]|nr:hypothetical protein [Candidatus Saccharibacteria bacterium]
MKAKKKATLLVTGAILLILALYYLQRNIISLNIEEIKAFVNSFGILGPLVLTALITLTIVISPIASLPFWFVSLALFGYLVTFLIIFAAHCFGSAINFKIAQKWGRPIVAKLVGKKGIEQIDEVTKIIGLKMLFIARLFGGASADYVSYAAGLTSMEFKPYLIISVFAAIPMIFLNVYFLDRILTINPLLIAVLAPLGYVLALVFPLVVYKWPKKRKEKLLKNR